jgi:DNA-binding IclR family transcriptional regulator
MPELEAQTSQAETGARRLGDRSEDEYMIEAAAKVLKVLEALEGKDFEPVNITRVAQRTGFNRTFCRSALITLKRVGWAKQLPDSKESLFVHGPKAERMAKNYMGSLLKRTA